MRQTSSRFVLSVLLAAALAGITQAASFPGDINSDGSVDVVDLLTLAESWGRSSGEPGYNPACDFDGDGSVDVTDLLMLAENWGKCLLPTITLVEPYYSQIVRPGDYLVIRWQQTSPAAASTVDLFYDTDLNPANGTNRIASLNEWPGYTVDRYVWVLPPLQSGTYHIGATIRDGINPPLTTYAPGTVGLVPPSLTLISPSDNLDVRPGESVIIAWTSTNPGAHAQVILYSDFDLIPDNGNEQALMTTMSSIESGQWHWLIPSDMPAGSYYILARLSNALDPPVYSYAPGRLSVREVDLIDAVRDLSQIGSVFPGATFDGKFANARLGEVLAGGKDFSGDGYPDFMLVAPKSHSTNAMYVETNVGEAYLVYSRGVSGRWPQGQTLPISTLGSYNGLQGVTFVGPSFGLSSGGGTTSGIQEVLFVADRDGDARPEILFGIPDVNRIFEDQQDYDPLDNNNLHGATPPAPAGWTPGRYYYQADGWQEFSDTPDLNLPAGDDLRPEGFLEPKTGATSSPGKRSGMIVYVSSQSEAAMRNLNVLLDEVGGRVNWARPNIARASGMRMYPLPSSDTTQWGAQMAVADPFGNQWGALLVARPMDAGGVGSVRIMLHQAMDPQFNAWTAAPDFTGWFNIQPKAWTFPAADSTLGTDPDRQPKWPSLSWNVFMDLFPATPDPRHYNIMNSDATVGANGHLGHPTNLNDFNGDTVGDIAVSAPDASPGGLAQAGAAYLVPGSPSLEGLDVSLLAQGMASGMELDGTQAGEQLGWKMVGPGDLNYDGYKDWLLTAPNRSWAGRQHCGAVAIVHGRAGLYGRRTVDEVVPTLGGAMLYGPDADARLGLYLAAVGDVDRDGHPDFAAAAPGYDSPGRADCGAVYLIYGGPHLVGEFDLRDIGTAQLPGRIYVGPAAGVAVGPVAEAGDTDGDLYSDFLIGSPNSSAQGLSQAGRAWLIYGGRRNAP